SEDQYDGVLVDERGLPEDVDAFVDLLSTSIEVWRGQGRKGVWLKLPLSRAELVPVSAKLGFVYHHAE
ncbi:unnamed protein product, partial [Phaeothamnion confervicola]